MSLNGILQQLSDMKGLVLFSQFLLPRDRLERQELYVRLLEENCELHAALEETSLMTAKQISAFDAILTITPWLDATPSHGRFSCGRIQDRTWLNT